MLDRDHAVVAHRAQHADDVFPVCVIVAVAKRPEHPRTVENVAVALGVENAVLRHVGFVDADVLAVDVINRLAQVPDRLGNVDALPDQVARVEVRADDRAHRRAQLKKRLRVVNAEARVHLEGDFLDSVLRREGRGLLPVGNQNLVPLPVENLRVVVRPRACDPVGVLRIGAVAGAAGEADYRVDAELLAHEDRVDEVVVVLFRDFLVRVDRIAVAAEGADLQAVPVHRLLELAERLLVVKKDLGLAVGVARVAAASDLDALGAGIRKIFHRFGGGKVAEQHADYSYFHCFSSGFFTWNLKAFFAARGRKKY